LEAGEDFIMGVFCSRIAIGFLAASGAFCNALFLFVVEEKLKTILLGKKVSPRYLLVCDRTPKIK
jgi:hypothetical protein